MNERWIRITGGRARYHLVIGEGFGLSWTFCGLSVRVGKELRRLDYAPLRNKCDGCKTRIKHPYLIPDKLAKLFPEAVHADPR